jgi:hypothetical protein
MSRTSTHKHPVAQGGMQGREAQASKSALYCQCAPQACLGAPGYSATGQHTGTVVLVKTYCTIILSYEP